MNNEIMLGPDQEEKARELGHLSKEVCQARFAELIRTWPTEFAPAIHRLIRSSHSVLG